MFSGMHNPLKQFQPRGRVPFMQQFTAVECGAACLAMILNFHGEKVTIQELREACSVGRDGLKALTIADIARRYGLIVRAYSVQVADLSQVSLPAILHWGFNHFIVLESVHRNGFVIVDPAAGRRTVSIAEFREFFTGIVLTFSRASPQTLRPKALPGSLTRYLLELLRGPSTKGIVAQTVISSFVVQLLGLSVPLFIALAIDRVVPLGSLRLLWNVSSALALVSISQAIVFYLRSITVIHLRAQVDSIMMDRFVRHLFGLPYVFFQQRSSGDLLMRLQSNSILRELLSNQVIALLLDGCFLIFYLGLMAWILPVFALGAAVAGVLQCGVVLLTSERLHTLAQQELTAISKEQGYLVEAIKGILTVKASGTEQGTVDRWGKLFTGQLNVALERMHVSAITDSLLSVVKFLTPVALLSVSIEAVLQHRIGIGSMMALQALAGAYLAPVGALASTAQQLRLAQSHFERLSDVLTSPSAGVPDLPTAPGEAQALRIEFRNVSFRYGANTSAILSNVSFTAEPGQKVAIVGPSGCGKSTLLMLLAGLCSPTSGEVLINGIPTTEIKWDEMRSRFGVVLQETFLFGGSIRQNLTFGNLNTALEEVEQLATVACLHEEVASMPMGYETIVSEGGSNLSGGQRQRLAIARALGNKPSVLLLDEATSNLDVDTEARLETNLQGLSSTRIVIAHRLSTVRNADMILVLERGSVIERGTHNELIKMGGLYAQLASIDNAPQAPVMDSPSPALEGSQLWWEEAIPQSALG